MDDWQQEWAKSLETLANNIGQFFEEVGKEIGAAADALIELTEEMAEHFEETIAPGLDQFDQQMTEWIDPIVLALLGLEESIDQAVEPVTHTVEPWLNQHPICMGCRNYHGQVYNGNMLVCAMHPYGIPEDVDTCPDKEPIAWALPPSLQNWTTNSEDNHQDDR